VAVTADAQIESLQTGRAGGNRSSLRVALDDRGVLRVVRRDPLPALSLSDGHTLTVNGVAIYEPGREEVRLLGIRMDLSQGRRGAPLRSIYLDLHEIEPLLRAMANMQPLALAAGGHEARTEFVTREGFTVGVAVRNDKPTAFVRSEPTGPNLALPGDGLKKLGDQITQARTALFQE